MTEISNPVDPYVLRYIVRLIDGQVKLPKNTSSPGFEFLAETVRGIQEYIRENSVEELVADPRGEAPPYGAGTPLDLLRPVEMLRVAADIDATEFDGTSPEEVLSLEDAVRWTLMAIHDDMWSAAAEALEEGDLREDTREEFRGVLHLTD